LGGIRKGVKSKKVFRMLYSISLLKNLKLP
jgi:hypothetical protein